jgi:CheY-like chemotaxis protein
MSKVLVVDDEVEICLLVTQYLKKIGLRDFSFPFPSPRPLKKLRRNPYDLIFVDLNLRDGSGYDLIKALHKSKSSTKVIVISAYDSERQKALQKGASFFLG